MQSPGVVACPWVPVWLVCICDGARDNMAASLLPGLSLFCFHLPTSSCSSGQRNVADALPIANTHACLQHSGVVLLTPTSASGSVPCEADVDGVFLTAESSDSSEGGPPYLIPGLPLSVYGDPHPTVRRLFGAWAYISCAVQRLLLGCRGRMNDPFPVPPSSWTSCLPDVPSHHPTAWRQGGCEATSVRGKGLVPYPTPVTARLGEAKELLGPLGPMEQLALVLWEGCCLPPSAIRELDLHIRCSTPLILPCLCCRSCDFGKIRIKPGVC